jgi:probable phosphoglycerate mutase
VTRLILWRHGVTDWNLQGRFQGRSDIQLNADGVLMAKHSAPFLATYHPTLLFSSPLKRALRTAKALAKVTGLPIQQDPGVMEIFCDDWEGRLFSEVKKEHPEFVAALDNNQDFRRGTHGETYMETGARVGDALRRIVAANEGETIAVASHGTAIQMAITNLLGWDYAHGIALGSLANCSWSVLDLKFGNWRLSHYNVTAPSVSLVMADETAWGDPRESAPEPITVMDDQPEDETAA